MGLHTIGSPAAWIGFVVFVLAMLALDLGVFHKRAHVISPREALGWSGAWVGLAALFGVGIALFSGSDAALEFVAGYLIEKSLAVDNIFVIAVIFGYFAVPLAYQHRVLFWGILGALLLRAVFIALGAALLARFHWVAYVFGAALLYTGVKLAVQRPAELDVGNRPVVRWFRRFVPMRPDFAGQKLLVREPAEGGRPARVVATPLLLCLVVVELADLVFALDSIPAIFGVTNDPFIVFTSNIFAILGLRSMYFLLAGALEKFRFLKLGLSAVLCFVGAKMLLAAVYTIPIGISLGVIASLLIATIWASIRFPKPAGARESRGDADRERERKQKPGAPSSRPGGSLV